MFALNITLLHKILMPNLLYMFLTLILLYRLHLLWRKCQGIIRGLSMPVIILKGIPNTIIAIDVINRAVTFRWE